MNTGARGRLFLSAPVAHTLLEKLHEAQVAASDEGEVGPERLRLAALQFALGHDQGVIATLSGAAATADAADRADALLARALTERAGAEDLDRARALLVRLAARAKTASQRAAASADLAKTFLNAARPEEARKAALAALADDGDNGLGWLRLIRASLACGEAESLRRTAEARIGQGTAPCGALAARDTAWAVIDGRPVSALDFLRSGRIEAPGGWPSLEAFNADLAAELLANPSLAPSRTGGEGGARRRVNDPLLEGRSPVFAALLPRLTSLIEARMAEAEGEVPWSQARPPAADLRIWAVVTHGSGHDRWHMHVQGWLSGVYYVRTPEATGGEIELGCPEIAGARPLLHGARRRLRPRAGDWLTFPSHLHHRTWPTGAAEPRIAVAFDVMPRSG